MTTKLYEKFKNFINFLKKEKFVVIVLTIFLLVNFIKVPYEVEMPGGIINLNNRVIINGEELDPKGSYNMAYVSSVNGYIPYILAGLVIPDWEVSKTSNITLENESIDDYYERNKISLEQSKYLAIETALKAANIDYEITEEKNIVSYIYPSANTDLKFKDNVLKIDGVDIDNDTLKETINSKDVGEEITISVNRDGEDIDCKAKIFEQDDQKYIGIIISIYNIIKSDYDIELKSKDNESGPSGGMMMALMIYSGITDNDLTKGRKIVGTGTISSNGDVGPIGGVKYKLMGAVKNKADVFLVPKDNYEEALEVKEDKNYKIEIVSIETLQDAIDYLED